MGLRPLMGFKNAGIMVYLGEGAIVKDSIDRFMENRLDIMTEDFVCGGH